MDKSAPLSRSRLAAITKRYGRLRIAVAGDFCLDRYLEIDPARAETSIETGLTVHNVMRVRSQPGGAGTILNNLVALGIGRIYPIGFCGQDGEGYELRRALSQLPGVDLCGFFQTNQRRTFTYAKPLLMHTDRPPEELSRLDSKNWTATPATVERRLIRSLEKLSGRLDALILLDQVDVAQTGVVTSRFLAAVGDIAARRSKFLILADSRRGLGGFPAVTLKMNRSELGALTGQSVPSHVEAIQSLAVGLAREKGRTVFVTLAEAGMIGATPNGQAAHVPAFPVRGPIDIVGAGDAVTANLTASMAGGANMREALWVASAASSIVIHQLGTTGTADVAGIGQELSRLG
jgi:rfaE bifunctional protein kinase chain/domain